MDEKIFVTTFVFMTLVTPERQDLGQQSTLCYRKGNSLMSQKGNRMFDFKKDEQNRLPH